MNQLSLSPCAGTYFLRRLFCLICLFTLTACGTVNGTNGAGSGEIPPAERQAKKSGPAAHTGGRPVDPGQAQAAGTGKKVTPTNNGKKKPFTPTPGKEIVLGGPVSVCWIPLVERLQSDDMGEPIYTAYFTGLADYSSAPMSVKVKELFTNAFLRKTSTTTTSTTVQPGNAKARIYNKVVTEATMKRCEDFLTEHAASFTAVEKKYPVPKEIIAALLYVETRHGDYLGSANAFWSLACMAAATEPDQVSDGIADLPITEEHQEWLKAKLTDKSGWAYKELKALLVYCYANDLDPRELPGSVYGAIGLCQFMPSNLIPYGDDGDGDGKINLFSPPDAIFSVAKYLTDHGWKKDSTVDEQRNLLRLVGREQQMRHNADLVGSAGADA